MAADPAAAWFPLALVIPMLAPRLPGPPTRPASGAIQEQYWVWYAPGLDRFLRQNATSTSARRPAPSLEQIRIQRRRLVTTSCRLVQVPAQQLPGYRRSRFRHLLEAADRTHFTRIGRIKRCRRPVRPRRISGKSCSGPAAGRAAAVIRGEMIADIFAIDSFRKLRPAIPDPRRPGPWKCGGIRLLRLVQSTITQRNL